MLTEIVHVYVDERPNSAAQRRVGNHNIDFVNTVDVQGLDGSVDRWFNSEILLDRYKTANMVFRQVL